MKKKTKKGAERETLPGWREEAARKTTMKKEVTDLAGRVEMEGQKEENPSLTCPNAPGEKKRNNR